MAGLSSCKNNPPSPSMRPSPCFCACASSTANPRIGLAAHARLTRRHGLHQRSGSSDRLAVRPALHAAQLGEIEGRGSAILIVRCHQFSAAASVRRPLPARRPERLRSGRDATFRCSANAYRATRLLSSAAGSQPREMNPYRSSDVKGFATEPQRPFSLGFVNTNPASASPLQYPSRCRS